MRINEEIDDAIQQGLASLNNEKLHQIYHSWKAIHEKREHIMLQNIYNYETHCYARRYFLLGMPIENQSAKNWGIMKRKKC
jgi:hypothetical protein